MNLVVTCIILLKIIAKSMCKAFGANHNLKLSLYSENKHCYNKKCEIKYENFRQITANAYVYTLYMYTWIRNY
jgi:hypothetical protein